MCKQYDTDRVPSSLLFDLYENKALSLRYTISMKNFLKSVVVKILVLEARMLIRRQKPKIIAITGSVGKTSTKDAIYAAIRSNVYARKSEKSYNSDIGVTLTVLGLPNAWNNPFLWLKNIIDGLFTALFTTSYPEVLVLETGIDRPGDMARLTSWLKPDIVVLTRLPDVPVHVEYFSSPAQVVAEKMKLVSAMSPEGTLIYNADDTIIESQLPEVLQKRVGYTRYLKSDFTARRDRVVYADDQPTGIAFTLTDPAGETFSIAISGTVGLQFVYAAAAAMAVAAELDVPLDGAAIALKGFVTPRGRMRIMPGIKASFIIDDTYNSSPEASKQALLALSEIKYAKRKIAVLGDMLELGNFSGDEHRKIGSQVPAAADMLITVGVRSRKIAEGAMATGMSEENVLQYEDADRAGRELQTMLKTGDVVLVKASQGLRAERIVEEIMAEPDKAEQLLVRQDAAWRRR